MGMDEGFDPYHVPQKRRRDTLNFANVQLQGLLPIYDPSLCSSDFMTGEDGGAHSRCWGNNNDCGTACTGGVTPPELRRRNFLDYAALENFSGVSNSSTSSVSNLMYMTDPLSSTQLNTRSIQKMNPYPFHYNSFKFFNHVCPPADELSAGSTRIVNDLKSTIASTLPLDFNLQNYKEDSSIYSKKMGYFIPPASRTVSGTVNDLSRNSAPLNPVTGYDFVLNGSRFLGPTLQLLREICDVGEENYPQKLSVDTVVLDPSMANIAKNADEDSQRRLMLLLIEEYKRYKQCCHKIHEVVASFESVAGVENAAPFASMAVKEMTKRSNLLRNLISDQLQQFLTEPHDGHNVVAQGKYIAPQRSNTSSATGKLILGAPNKGHPTHAIIILKAWFFNHFLQPYPTDIDRLILAIQTGLSESQVSNWFINARVRLWKPMVEELRMLETRQAHKSSHEEVMSNVHDRESNQLIHRGSNTTVPLYSLKTPTPVQRIQDNIMSLKRARNESTAAEKNALLMDSNCENLSAFPQMGLGVSSGGANGGIWGEIGKSCSFNP